MRNNNAPTTFLNRVRVLCCTLAIVACAALVATLLSSPRAAYADDVTVITQDSFTDNVLTINSGGTYQLGEDVIGSIQIWSASDGVTLDLNGKTLTCPSGMTENNGYALYINKPEGFLANYVVKNGTIVQNNDGHDAIHIYWQHFSKSLLLENLIVTAHNASCLSTDTSNTDNSNATTVSGGSYTTTNDEGTSKPTMYAHDATVVIQDGTKVLLNGEGDVVQHDSSDGQFTIKSGSYSKLPSGTKVALAEDLVVFKSSADGATWDVVRESAACEGAMDGGKVAGWYVTVNDYGTVYFDSEKEASDFAAEKGSEVGILAAARVGETYYISLQSAIDAAGADDTVVLIADTTESVTIGKGKSVNIDLGGKKLTASGSDDAISKTGSGTVNISNGTIVSEGSCASINSNSAAAVVTLDGVDATCSGTSAISCISGTVNVKSGTFCGTDTSNGNAISMGSNAVVNIYGGSLTGGNGVDINLGTATHLSVSGGDFSNTENVVDHLASGCSLQYKSGRYYAVDSSTDDAVEALKAESRWVLTTSDGSKIYYGADDETQASADKGRLNDSTLAYIYHVTFNDDKGEAVKTLGRTSGEALGTLPSPGTREDYSFEGWLNGSDAAAETTTVNADVTYTASWKSRGVAKIGETYYSDLQAALDAAKSGDTVVLLQDTSGNFEVGKSAEDDFTLDLNGYTITRSGHHYYILYIMGESKLTIKGGTIKCQDGGSYNCIECGVDSTEPTAKMSVNLTLQDVTVSSTGRAVSMQVRGGTLTVASGAVLSGDKRSASVYCGSVNIEDGAKIYGDFWTSVVAMTVSGGWFSGGIINSYGNNTNNITGGSFGNNTNADDVADGYVMEGPDADGRYTVVKDTAAPVISGIEAGKVYEGATTFTVSDDSSVTVTAGGVTLTPSEDGTYTLSAQTLADVTEGALTVTATDAADNASSVKITWYKDHDWSDWTAAADGENHTSTCSHCGQTKTEEHSGGTATCTSKATCEKCGATYGSTDATNHSGTESSAWTTSDTQHWHTCTACGNPWDYEADHSLSWVTTVEPTYTSKGHKHEVCSVCGYTCNETDIDALDPGAPVISGIVDGDCYDVATTFTVAYKGDDLVVKANDTQLYPDSSGNYELPIGDGTDVVVTASGKGGTASVTVRTYTSHEWGYWQSKADGTHVRACTHKGCSATDEGACFGDKATCVSTSVCKDCGYQLAPVDPTNHAGTIPTEWESDGENHWHVCDACQGMVDEAKHELVWVTDKEATDTEDGLKHEECSECGYKTGNTEVIPHTGSDDKGDDSDDKGDKGDSPEDRGGDSDDKSGDSDSKGDSNEKAGGSESSTAVPRVGDPTAIVSGIAVAGFALAGLGALRRRK